MIGVAPALPFAPVFRFAPSPTGHLHLGHALSAIVGHTWAQRLGGRFLVRIEDIDADRVRPEFAAAIFEDLAWLGLAWETPVLFQSQHLDDYRRAADRLAAMGLLYPCHATRGEIAAAVASSPVGTDPDGSPLYPGRDRVLPAAEQAARQARGDAAALRLDMSRALTVLDDKLAGRPLTFTALDGSGRSELVACRPERWGDVVLVRKSMPTSYHLAVVVDDARQGVTHVTRGRDLLPATDLHRVLQVLLDLPEPHYHHHRLILGPDGRKLSKSAWDRSLREMRRQGLTPADIRAMLGAV